VSTAVSTRYQVPSQPYARIPHTAVLCAASYTDCHDHPKGVPRAWRDSQKPCEYLVSTLDHPVSTVCVPREYSVGTLSVPWEYPVSTLLKYPISTLGVPREYPSCRCTRARIAAHRRRRGELPGVRVPQEYPRGCEYPSSTPLNRVPREYPICTAILRVGKTLPSTADFPRMLPQAPEALSPLL
jgi:hypothetical protein